MFSNLADSLDKTFRNLRGVGKISESNITEALRDIRLALLEADVEFSVAKEFVAHVKEQAMGADVLKSIKPGEQIVKIFHDELAELLGGDQVPLDLTPPARIMLCGLNGEERSGGQFSGIDRDVAVNRDHTNASAIMQTARGVIHVRFAVCDDDASIDQYRLAFRCAGIPALYGLQYGV